MFEATTIVLWGLLVIAALSYLARRARANLYEGEKLLFRRCPCSAPVPAVARFCPRCGLAVENMEALPSKHGVWETITPPGACIHAEVLHMNEATRRGLSGLPPLPAPSSAWTSSCVESTSIWKFDRPVEESDQT